MKNNAPLFQGLAAVGELLAFHGHSYACVVAGGTSLAALGVIDRPTQDVDVMAVLDAAGEIRLSPPRFPPFMEAAVRATARELGLPAEWMNTTMARGVEAGFPDGLESRLEWRTFGALRVGFVSRVDLIALKLEAASDDPPRDRTEVHAADLVALNPTDEEFSVAAEWVRRVDVDDRREASISWVREYVANRRSR